jgi:hypothetical protein
MVAIDADNRNIRRAMEQLVTRTTACGAEFSRDLILRCRQGSLSVASKAGGDGTIIRLPARCFLRLDQFQFSQQGDEMVVSSWAEDVRPALIPLADALTELYNICEKPKVHRRTSAWLFLKQQPELAPVIAEGRDDPSVRYLLDRTRTPDIDALAFDTFLKSRVMRLGDVVAIMPVGEFVNHNILAHPYGFPPNKDGGGVAIRKMRFPESAGDECFVRYGFYDSLDSWLSYSFIEENSPFVRSALLDITLPGVGVIGVHSHLAPPEHVTLPPELLDLQRYMPHVLSKTADRIDVSFLLIPTAAPPSTLRRVLRAIIGQLAPNLGSEQADGLVASAETQVIDKNRAYYEGFQQKLNSLSLKDPAKKPILDDLKRLCTLQLSRIAEYGK